MRVTYTPYRGTLKELAQAYADSFAPPRDGDPSKVPYFVETMIYTATEAVLMTGRYASNGGLKPGFTSMHRQHSRGVSLWNTFPLDSITIGIRGVYTGKVT